MADTDSSFEARSPLDRARTKAYFRLLPLLFLGYLIAYVDRSNVSILKLMMVRDLPEFGKNNVFGVGMGIFFVGYCLLEIPGTLIIERWSARMWLGRIMITWGIMAALTAWVREPWHFNTVRFLLGMAEAGFYPGVIVYLTHWFTSRDRSRALAYFFMAGPLAQLISPKITNLMLPIGTDVDHPAIWGMVGWQWAYIFWGLPAVVLGVIVLFLLTDRPGQARWLDEDERKALEDELAREKAEHPGGGHMTVKEALTHRKVLTLTAAYFFVVTGNYGVEMFMPSILKQWYNLKMDDVTWLVVLPPIGSLAGQFFVGWNSDRVGERRFHTVLPIYMGAAALLTMVLVPSPPVWLTVGLFVVAMTGLKAYLPAFWSLPSLFLTQSAAAGSIGLINSVGNLGGGMGPWMMGKVEALTGSFRGGLTYLAVSMTISATIILRLGLGKKAARPTVARDPLAEPVPELA